MRGVMIYGGVKMVGEERSWEENVWDSAIFDPNVNFFIMWLLGHEILTDFDDFQEEYQEDDEL